MTQSAARKAALQARRSLSPERRQEFSAECVARLRQLHIWPSAKHVAVFAALNDEVDVSALWTEDAKSRNYYLPIMRSDSSLSFANFTPDTPMKTRVFGIQEPVHTPAEIIDTKKLDIVVTPLAAFDQHANRIGMGGGYYDRSFAFVRNPTINKRPYLVGVAFEVQKIEQVRCNSWDVSLDAIITEKQVYSRPLT